MKKTTASILYSFCLLLFTQCSKPWAEQQAIPAMDAQALTQALSTAAAPFLNCSCQESAAKVSGPTAEAWAAEFAPLVKFDRAAPDYPTTVENIWANTDPASMVCGGKLVLTNDDAPRSLDFPTYYEVQLHPGDANKAFIDYWWLYKRQGNCIGSTGGHDYDLEHLVVQVNLATRRIRSVTYFQHSGWYTKDGQSIAPGTRIEAYVGKRAHGMYHFPRSSSFAGYECSYWGDYRNPNGSKDEVLTANRLVQLSCQRAEFNYSGDWGNPGKGPLFRDRAYWNFPSCKGTDGALGKADGCSECDFGPAILLGTL